MVLFSAFLDGNAWKRRFHTFSSQKLLLVYSRLGLYRFYVDMKYKICDNAFQNLKSVHWFYYKLISSCTCLTMAVRHIQRLFHCIFTRVC